MRERERINLKYFDFSSRDFIDKIEMRKIGILDVFGKIEIDVYYKDHSIKEYVIFSPVDTNKLKELLERDKLYKKTKLYEF